MKVLTKIRRCLLNPFLFTLLIVMLVACKEEDEVELNEQDKVRNALVSGLWKIKTVTVDEVDRTTLFIGLTLKFSKNTYTSTNGEPVWPTSGTWTFVDEKANTFLRDDNITVTILEHSENTLQLSLEWNKTTIGNGRFYSTKGVHVFSFTK